MRRDARLGAIVCSLFLAFLILTSGSILTMESRTTAPFSTSKIVQAAVSNADWHEGGNQSTPEVDVSYTDEYGTVPSGNNTSVQIPVLGQDMWLIYKDGTEARVEFQFHCAFASGGLDITNQKVLNWSKLVSIELLFFTESHANNTLVSTMYSFQGFSIVSGNASQVGLSRVVSGNSTIYALNNVIGSISYWSTSGKISNVILTTVPYVYQGSTLQESVASFNVTINSVISNAQYFMNNPTSKVNVPTVLTFRVTHNVNQTTYKYGADVDWSSAKAFPTSSPIPTGQDFSLVAQDLLAFTYGYSSTEVKQFSTDAMNDTAIYLVQRKELCRELFTTQYTINGDPRAYNTRRIYMPNVGNDPFSGAVSSVYVILGGFRYNQSTGFMFDPEVITPNTLVATNNPSQTSLTTSLVLAGTAIFGVAITALVLMLRRRRQASTTADLSKGQENIHFQFWS